MRRITRRKLRKNKRTQRRKTLGVKRGGVGGRSKILSKILGFSEEEKAANEAAIEKHKRSKEIIQSLANLVINNLDDDEKKQICPGENDTRTKITKITKLKEIHFGVLGRMLTGQTGEYTYVFKETDQRLQNILNNLKSKAGLEIVDLKYDKSLVIYGGGDFMLGLGVLSIGNPLAESEINILLYTMLAVCNEYLKRKKSEDVVYEFTDFGCSRYTSVPVMRESTA